MTAPREQRRIAPPSDDALDDLPLKEVVKRLAAGVQELHQLDDAIGMRLRKIERAILQRRPTGYPVDVPFPPWGKLGWSGRRGRWRLVVLEDDEYCTDLFGMPALCRVDACHVLPKLIERLGLA